MSHPEGVAMSKKLSIRDTYFIAARVPSST